MKMTTSFIRPRGVWGGIAVAASLFFLFCAAFCGYSYACDCAWLDSVTRDLTKKNTASGDKVVTLARWIQTGLDTGRNENRFLFARLGATPVQIMREGGDCADKSRLLCAMLWEIDIPATPVMCFDPESGTPTHTIVEAEIADGSYMAVDPAYGLYFPRSDRDGYFDLLDLRRDPSIVDQRITTLSRRTPGMREQDKYYLRAQTGYHGVSTFNWTKGAVSGVIHDFLGQRMGDEVYRLRRPAFLERPKLMVAAVCIVLAIAVQLIAIITRMVRRRHPRCPARQDPPAASRRSYSGRPSPA